MKKIFNYFLVAAACLALLPSCETGAGLSDSQFIYFSVTEPYARIGGVACSINPDTMEITNDDPIPFGIDLANVTPYFVTTHEGKVFVDGVEQTSGVTRQDLTRPVVYEVVSDRETLRYTVRLTYSDYYTDLAVKLTKSDLVSEITSEKQSWIADGVCFSTVEFEASGSRHVRFNLLEADMSGTSLGLTPLLPRGASSAPSSGSNWPVQTVLDQAKAASEAGTKVLVAINGGLFNTHTGEPNGPVVKNGSLLKDTFSSSSTEFFGIRSDGRLSMGGESDFYSIQANILNVVGAETSLMERTSAMSWTKGDSSKEPMVVAGMNSLDLKTLYLLSVEGVGTADLTAAEICPLLIELGVGHAVCMGRGENCSFVVKGDNGYSLVSGSAQQEQPCSLALVEL